MELLIDIGSNKLLLYTTTTHTQDGDSENRSAGANSAAARSAAVELDETTSSFAQETRRADADFDHGIVENESRIERLA